MAKRRQPFALTVVLLLLVAATSVTPAAAAEKTADLAKYCRQNHGRDAFPNVDRRDDSLMCSRRTDGGLGLLHRKIKSAEVCAAQHGTQRYRRQGKGLICITGSGSSTRAARTIDLTEHCRTRYGRRAFVTRRLTDDRPLCTVPIPGGQRHHLINLARLCRSAIHRSKGNKLICEGRTAGTTPGGGGTATGTGKSGPLPRTKRVGGGALRKSDFRGCSGPHLWIKTKNIIKAGRVWEYGGTTLPCPKLSGGRVVDLAAYCRARHAGRSKSVHLFWVTSQEGRLSPEANSPACGAGLKKGQPYNLRPIQVPRACAWAAGVAKGSSWVKWYNKGPQVIATRLQNRRLTCFYIPRAQWAWIWIAPQRIEFVAADPPRKVLTRLRPGQRFIVRLVYKREHAFDTQPVILRHTKGDVSIRLTARRVKGTKVFETGVVRLTPRVTR